MDVRVSEERPGRKVAAGVRRVGRLGRKCLRQRFFIKGADVRYGLLGGERWQSDASKARHQRDQECLLHKFCSHNQVHGFISVFFFRKSWRWPAVGTKFMLSLVST